MRASESLDFILRKQKTVRDFFRWILSSLSTSSEVSPRKISSQWTS